jgi:hypothetical protein
MWYSNSFSIFTFFHFERILRTNFFIGIPFLPLIQWILFSSPRYSSALFCLCLVFFVVIFALTVNYDIPLKKQNRTKCVFKVRQVTVNPISNWQHQRTIHTNIMAQNKIWKGVGDRNMNHSYLLSFKPISSKTTKIYTLIDATCGKHYCRTTSR